MITKSFKLGHIGYVPIFMDSSFLILGLLWLFHLMNAASVNAGLVLVAGFFGLVLSILLHELGHSLVADWLGVRTRLIEFNGLGGLCRYAGALPAWTSSRIAIHLAGPVLNLAIWQALTALETFPYVSQDAMELAIAHYVAQMNLVMFFFNLLPAFPLDGGKALAELLTKITSARTATIVVGWAGMAVTVLCILGAFKLGFWMLIIALSLFVANREELRSVGQWRSNWP